MKKRVFLVFFLFIFLSNFSSADFIYFNNSIEKVYSSGDNVAGFFNISFKDAKADSLLTSNFPGNISLLEFLEIQDLTLNEDYNCSLKDCLDSYSSTNTISSLSVTGESILGFKLEGEEVLVRDIKLKIESDSPNSCLNPLSINIPESFQKITSDVYTQNTCFSKNYGCFSSSNSYQNVTISNTQICEKLTLPPAPAYKLGAKITNSTKGIATLSMTLYTTQGSLLEKCNLPNHIEKTEELSCIVNHRSSISQEYLVCVLSNIPFSSTSPDYTIRSETSSPVCGSNDLGDTFKKDYEIFAQSMEFGKISIQILDSSKFFSPDKLSSIFQDYLEEKYNSFCKPFCIVPIKFSGNPQNLIFSDINLAYLSDGDATSTNSLYTTSIQKPKINSKPIQLDLSLINFTIDSPTKKEFILYLDDEIIFQQKINISDSFQFDISPKFALHGINTIFSINLNKNISKISVDFGDGVSSEFLTKNFSHSYKSPGNYKLIVSVKDSQGLTSIKKFNIFVGNPKESASIKIADFESKISNLTQKILSYPSWIQNNIKNTIELEELKSSIKKIKDDFNSSESDEDYISVVEGLLNLYIPYSISTTQSGEIPLIAGLDSINSDYIKSISNFEGEISDESFKSSVSSWITENFDAQISFQTISSFSDLEISPLLTSFKIDLTKLSSDTEIAYLIIDRPFDSITFLKDYGQKLIESATYIPIKSSLSIEFLAEDGEDFSSLGFYLSPDIQFLEIFPVESEIEEFEKKYPIGRVSIIISIIFFSFLVIYIILQEWYKKRYESYLFKSAEDIYNLINFISNARKSGLNDSDIRIKLSRNGWNNEQITYAFKRFDGKRTGMFEIPLFRFLEQKKIKSELEKRNFVRGKIY